MKYNLSTSKHVLICPNLKYSKKLSTLCLNSILYDKQFSIFLIGQISLTLILWDQIQKQLASEDDRGIGCQMSLMTSRILVFLYKKKRLLLIQDKKFGHDVKPTR